MKKIILFYLVFLLFSCSHKDIIQDFMEIKASINSADTYEYELSKGIPTEGGYSIHSDAKNADRSEIIFAGGMKYIYVPKNGFKGIDEVIIRNCISAGGPDCVKIDYIKIIISVE